MTAAEEENLSIAKEATTFLERNFKDLRNLHDKISEVVKNSLQKIKDGREDFDSWDSYSKAFWIMNDSLDNFIHVEKIVTSGYDNFNLCRHFSEIIHTHKTLDNFYNSRQIDCEYVTFTHSINAKDD